MIEIEWWVAVIVAAYVFQIGVLVGGRLEVRCQQQKKAMDAKLEYYQREVNAIIADMQKDHKSVSDITELVQ